MHSMIACKQEVQASKEEISVLAQSHGVSLAMVMFIVISRGLLLAAAVDSFPAGPAAARK